MIGSAAFARTVRLFTVALILHAAGSSVLGVEGAVTRTNWVDRSITNFIEVRMPLNRFVNEYHTNWIPQLRTNVIDLYVTNQVTRTLTNRMVVDALRTNFVTAYQTNWQTLNLTRWQTVVVMKTNWLTQPVTNLVQVDLPTNAAPESEAGVPNNGVAPNEPSAETSLPSTTSPSTEALILQAARTARPPANDQIEVQLKVKANTAAPSLRIQQWRIEREDGAILCFGQDQEFKRELPAGRYKVEVKARLDEASPLLSARGTLAVTPTAAVIQQKLAAKK
jgi:hypothetical protein